MHLSEPLVLCQASLDVRNGSLTPAISEDKILKVKIMILKDLMQQGNITISVSLNDLKEFAQDLIKTTKQELEQQITDANTETYPSPEQVAKILDVDRTTLWRWHKKGYLCHTEVGGKRRYRMSDINAILNGGK